MAKLSAKTQRKIYSVLIAVLSVILACCIGLLIWYGAESRQSEKLYSNLQSMVDAVKSTLPIRTEPSDPVQTEATTESAAQPEETEPTSPWVEVTDPETGEILQILPEYAEIYQMNNDLVGWIRIEGSDINYPVMQTPNNPDYYLKRDFNGEHSFGGTLYAEEEADVFAPSDNVTIYGHRMNDDSMFNQLIRYQDEAYFQKYPYIQFDTLKERHVYEIVFVFKTSANLGQGFAYHNFVNARDLYEFYDFVDRCRELTFYNSSAKLTYGDKLLTLSTCEYTLDNGRFVVVARRIS